MYEVVVSYVIYKKWESYKKWDYDGSYNEWVPLNYPEILSVEWDPEILSVEWDPDVKSRIFRFESEDHYHWFLLRQ